MKAPPAQRLMSRSRVDPQTGCHIWGGLTNHKGYGRMSVGGRLQTTHRIAYELANGPVPEGLVLDHLCRNRACFNPDHLEAVANRENILRGEGASAREARRTSCKRGHPKTDENTYVRPSGERNCRICKADGQRAAAKRLRETAPHHTGGDHG